MSNAEVETYKLFVEAAKDATKNLKAGKTAYFTCPACKAKALAKRESGGRLRAYCQGCGIRTM